MPVLGSERVASSAMWLTAWVQALELESVGSHPSPMTMGRIPNPSVPQISHL